MNNSKFFAFTSGAVSHASTTLVQGINSGLSDKDLELSVVKAALQNVCNIEDTLLFKAVSMINPNYKPNTLGQNDTIFDMAVMLLATEVVNQIYFINNQFPSEERNRKLCASMPLNLEDMWRSNEWVRNIRSKNKLSSDLSNLTLEEKTAHMEKELANAEGGCAGGACKL